MNVSRKEYAVRLFKIAIPIMISNLISQLQMLIDKMFLGRLDIRCMTAVGNATSPMWTTMNTIFSLTIGATILASQAVGEGNKEKAKNIINSLFLFNNILALFWFIFWLTCPRLVYTAMNVPGNLIDLSVSYARIYSPVYLMCGIGASAMSMLQVSEKTKSMVIYGVVRSACNIVLDYVLIFGKFGFPRMEVKGAALATTIAEFIGAGVLFIYIIKDNSIWLKPRIKEVKKASFSLYMSCVKLGLPTALEDFAWNFGNLYLIVMLNRVSDVAAGIYSIIFSVECLPVVVIGAIGNATLTLAGQETGRKNYGEIRKIVQTALIACLSVSAVILVIFRIMPETIMGWFTTDTSVIVASSVYLLIVGIDLFPKSSNIIFGSGIRGYGDTKWMLGTQLFGTFFIITVSSIMVICLHQGMTALFCVVVADETVRAGINYWKLRKVSKAE